MLTIDDYLMGRDKTYEREYSLTIRANGLIVVARVNQLLDRFYVDNPGGTTRRVNSGWRPPSLNATVPGAAKFSRQMAGQAVDLSDDDEELDDWLMSPNGEDAMRALGLWHESPDYTPRWAHVQIIPPGSGRLHFIP